MARRAIAIVATFSALMLFVLLFTTTPSDTGPLGILGFFVFMYLTVLGVLTFLFRAFSVFATRLTPKKRRELIGGGVTFRQSYYYASVVASVPVMFIAIQSVGEVGLYQVLLVAFFVAIAWIYVTNRTS